MFFAMPICAHWADKVSYIGTIQFPKSMQQVPHMRVYCRGNKIPCDAHGKSHKVTFALETEKQRTRFYLLISSDHIQLMKAKKIDPEMEQNTVEYLKMLPTQSYKMYQLDLIKEYAPLDLDEVQPGHVVRRKVLHRWRVTEVQLPDSGRIPDDAIIIRLNADYVADVEGGNGIEFPRIKLKSDVLKIAGSEKELFDEMAEVLFSSLDIDTLHANLRQEKRGDLQLKTIIAMAR
jgi:hypothetical protein